LQILLVILFIEVEMQKEVVAVELVQLDKGAILAMLMEEPGRLMEVVTGGQRQEQDHQEVIQGRFLVEVEAEPDDLCQEHMQEALVQEDK